MNAASKRFERRIVVAAVLESLVLIPAIWMFIRTEQILWIIGGAVIGSIPILYVIFTNARLSSGPRAPASEQASIVEDNRGLR